MTTPSLSRCGAASPFSVRLRLLVWVGMGTLVFLPGCPLSDDFYIKESATGSGSAKGPNASSGAGSSSRVSQVTGTATKPPPDLTAGGYVGAPQTRSEGGNAEAGGAIAEAGGAEAKGGATDETGGTSEVGGVPTGSGGLVGAVGGAIAAPEAGRATLAGNTATYAGGNALHTGGASGAGGLLRGASGSRSVSSGAAGRGSGWGAGGINASSGASGATSGSSLPVCPEPMPTGTRGGGCWSTDLQQCSKTCGPGNIGTKTLTCANGGDYAESACTYPAGQSYGCYKIPLAIPTDCPNAAPQDGDTCSVDRCTVCYVGLAASPFYLDSSGIQRRGYCVCDSLRQWSCASVEAWPCPSIVNGC